MLGAEELRAQIKRVREAYPHHWVASRKFVTPSSFPATQAKLLQFLQKTALVPMHRDRLVEAVQQFGQQPESRQTHQTLKELTGLPPSKAVRALIVWGILAWDEKEKATEKDLSTEQVEELVRQGFNPYEVLRHVTSPSLLDIGAGDLTFEQELVDQYVPQLRHQKTPLTLHAFDRLLPGSRVGGVYHTDLNRERHLQSFLPQEVQFKFWGGIGLEQLKQVKGLLPHYTVSTCHAPANPTFAYEPSRVASSLIHDHLRTTRGSYRASRYEGEPILEVRHRGHTLTFPPWKFDILGPVALLKLMAQRSRVGILSAVDDEVFWEVLSQLLADDRFRPPDQIFTKDKIQNIFATVYTDLSCMKVGERIDLSKVADLRPSMPFQDEKIEGVPTRCRLRYVEIRRGAVLEGVPSSYTASQFSQMKEESTPWWIIFVSD
jgi:hypothetical protein